MSTQQQKPVVDFDHHLPPDEIDPHENFRRLRNSCPVAWSERHGGFWVVTKHEHVGRVLKDSKHFSSSRETLGEDAVTTAIPPMPLPPFLPQELDPPRHLKLRRLLNAVLSPKASAALAPRIAHWTTHYIDQVIESGECDLVYDLAIPVPAAVTLEWIGVPPEDWQRMSEAFHDLSGYEPDHPRGVAAYESLAWMHERVAEELADRKENPRDDVLTYLVQQSIDGEPVPDEDLKNLVVQVIGGGVDTSTGLAAFALLHCHRQPEHRRRLIEEPELWSTATEEFLRRYPPFMSLARTVKEDVEIGGCPMRAGERVLASQGSACHDEDVYENPEQVVLDRHPNRHLAFGLGGHRCPGMHLAKLEFEEIVRQVFERMPDYRILEDRVVAYPNQSSISGLTSLPAVFTAGARRGND